MARRTAVPMIAACAVGQGKAPRVVEVPPMRAWGGFVIVGLLIVAAVVGLLIGYWNALDVRLP